MLTVAFVVGLLAVIAAFYVRVRGYDEQHDSVATDEAWIAGRQKVRRRQL